MGENIPMEWWMALLLLIGGTVLLMFMGLPVGVSFLFANLIGTLVFMGGLSGFKLLILNLEESLTSFGLLTVPMFILMGEVMFHSKMALRAIDALDYWIGRVPGRLGLLAVASGTIFGATSGSTIATTSMLGSLLIPEMERRGYQKTMCIGPILGSGALAMLIPPSILAVILATLVEVSVGGMLIAGILPGLLLASFYAIYILIRCWIQPEIAPPYDISPIPLIKKLKEMTIYVLPLGLIIFLVVGIIFLGMATPSEAAAMGAIGSIILSVFYGEMNWEIFRKCIFGTIKMTTFMFIIIMASMIFSQILAFSGASSGLIQAVVKLELPSLLVLISMQVTLLFLGCFMDNLSIAVIVVPIFMPVIKALGFDPLWVAAMTLINMDLGNLTPPFGLQLFVMKGIQPMTPMAVIIRSALPFVLCEVLALIAIMIFPDIALYLPSLMRKG
ncbi:MAG: TRAP transporter large permease subunit [Deltaproteobacteria bacterium]|nr:TRAP transporter large permease subunit [Deltaproteobacteria bacterium]